LLANNLNKANQNRVDFGHLDFAARAYKSRWFAPQIEFLRMVLAQNSKKTISPPSFGRGSGGWFHLAGTNNQ